MRKTNCLLVIAILAFIQPVWSQSSYLNLIGKSLPDLTLSTLEDKIIHTADLKGHGVVLNDMSLMY